MSKDLEDNGWWNSDPWPLFLQNEIWWHSEAKSNSKLQYVWTASTTKRTAKERLLKNCAYSTSFGLHWYYTIETVQLTERASDPSAKLLDEEIGIASLEILLGFSYPKAGQFITDDIRGFFKQKAILVPDATCMTANLLLFILLFHNFFDPWCNFVILFFLSQCYELSVAVHKVSLHYCRL